ncbi:ATP-binding protein [Cryobacterium sp. TMT4-10]|uniref:ATP-binding protein n=1 Tax=unclassified Cryobacterium TaxID=2649013 RepID=UPI003515EE7A
MFFQLVASRYEHASLILTSNLSFGRWGEVFGDQTVASAMIDRIVHHADVLSLKGASYRMNSHRPPPIRHSRNINSGPVFKRHYWPCFGSASTLFSVCPLMITVTYVERGGAGFNVTLSCGPKYGALTCIFTDT